MPFFVRFSGEKREYRAQLLGADPNTDLALIRIDPHGRKLPYLEFADSDQVEVGSWAVAVGNPFGTLESSLTVGVVSAKGRGDLQIGGQTPRYQDFIQTDASINFGNSGGPLVDVAGADHRNQHGYQRPGARHRFRGAQQPGPEHLWPVAGVWAGHSRIYRSHDRGRGPGRG